MQIKRRVFLMPIGVPKVPYLLPGEEKETWVDLYTRFYRERGLFLGDRIEAPLANHLISLMLYFNIEDDTKDIFLYINSPGGWALPGLSIYDTMFCIIPDINTICVGLAASMASLILAGGKTHKRLAFPHTRVMIHQPECALLRGRVRDLALEVQEVTKLRSNITKAYAERTGKPYWAVSADLEKDVFMSATEAQAYGILDKIGIEQDQEKVTLLIDDFFVDMDVKERGKSFKSHRKEANLSLTDLWDSE
uniref:clp protease proteolytic subunit n=1 Tax=Centrolepis aristata TaxID=357897 RepID=UPI001F13B962|nr:clp protease proteolytic subunit [Centrolepis aristata]ULQ64480.1 clp protease proteolytic subunit [Centrolepis aristata]